MTLGRTRGVALRGVSGTVVEVECFIGQGLPAFEIGGLPDTALRQAAQRVRAAAAGMGESLNQRPVMVNLSPAAIPKQGTAYDVSIAVAALAANGVLPAEAAREVVHVAEPQQVEQLGTGQRVEHLPALGTPGDQPAVPQTRHMRRHGGLRQPQLPDQVDHASLPVGQAAHDRQPGRVGQTVKQRHRRIQIRGVSWGAAAEARIRFIHRHMTIMTG